MRFSTTPTSFTEFIQGRLNNIKALYRGTTTNATATELFIDQQTARRLVPDKSSGGILRILACAVNTTTFTTLAAELFVTYGVNAAGVITLTDQDGVTGGSQDNVLSTVTTAGTRAGALGVTVGADNGVQVDAVQASGSTPGYLRVQVRGAAATNVSWEVYVDALEVTVTNS